MYLAYKTYSTQAKNALDKDFEAYLNSIDRTVIPESEIKDFIQGIQDDYKKLCEKNSRCKPGNISFYEHERLSKISLHGSHVTFCFLKSK